MARAFPSILAAALALAPVEDGDEEVGTGEEIQSQVETSSNAEMLALMQALHYR